MKKPRLLAALLLVAASSAAAQEYRLPFEGRWFVMQGGDTPNVNQHMGVRAQWYGIDFVKSDGPSRRALARTDGARIEDFYSWDAPVLAPGEGEVIEAVDGLPDNALGTKDAQHPLGNHVVLKAAPDRFVFLAHLRKGSVMVRSGQKIARGQAIGRCGNSGNSDFPHVHMHVQDRPVFNTGMGQNMLFSHIDVELTGKQFRDVDWPLIRGVFVENR